MKDKTIALLVAVLLVLSVVLGHQWSEQLTQRWLDRWQMQTEVWQEQGCGCGHEQETAEKKPPVPL